MEGLSEWGAPRWRAAVAAAKGDRGAAVRHLQSFFAQEPTVYYNNAGNEWDLWLHDFPEFDALWDYPQFRSLIRFPDDTGAEAR